MVSNRRLWDEINNVSKLYDFPNFLYLLYLIFFIPLFCISLRLQFLCVLFPLLYVHRFSLYFSFFPPAFVDSASSYFISLRFLIWFSFSNFRLCFVLFSGTFAPVFIFLPFFFFPKSQFLLLFHTCQLLLVFIHFFPSL